MLRGEKCSGLSQAREGVVMFGLSGKDWFYCFVTASVTLVWGWWMIVTVLSIGG
jgi:hypothetical protein